MNNPEAIRFVNEVVRPLSEKIRAVAAQCQSAKDTYEIDIKNIVQEKPSDAVEDSRESEGVSRLICSDISEVMEGIDLILTVEAKMTAITKACVRPLASE